MGRIAMGSCLVEPASTFGALPRATVRCEFGGLPRRVRRLEDAEQAGAAVPILEVLLHRLHRLVEGLEDPTNGSIMFTDQFSRNVRIACAFHHPLELPSGRLKDSKMSLRIVTSD